MKFRPCIDIHNGKVKQIVGGSLADAKNQARENFVAEQDASFYARLYRELGITGGHVILLNAKNSEFYEATKSQALTALKEWPGGLQVGGGITAENAAEFLDAGASHVIVTSYVFQGGEIRYDRLREMQQLVGKERLVLDLSCRRKGDGYVIVTDRWQKETAVWVNGEVLAELEAYCSEFLIHAVDVEGKADGIEEKLAALLGEWDGIPVTYAGGVHSYDDLQLIKKLGKDRLHVTIGSALKLFGGELELEKVLECCSGKRKTG